MQLTGQVKVIYDEQQVSEKFRKRDVVITDNSNVQQYPQHILVQATQDRVSILDNVKMGDTVTVHFNLKGRQWTSPQGEEKYFNTIEIWKCEKSTAAQPVVESKPQYASASSNDSGLPF